MEAEESCRESKPSRILAPHTQERDSGMVFKSAPRKRVE